MLETGQADTDRATSKKQIQRKTSLCRPDFCSKWFDKGIRTSSLNSAKNVFVAVETRWKMNQTKMIYASDDEITAHSGAFEALGYVAFPPISKGEIWSIGWIQGVKKKSTSNYADYGNKYRF